jgi:AraC family transcriptional regulator of adaptative response / DNA-3-methyladenine glycosylase II
VPGGWDGFEVAMRAVLGQQVSVAAARRLLGRLVQLCGTRSFPTATEVLAADLAPLGMPGARRATVTAVASAALEDPLLFRRRASAEDTVSRLRAIRGVGEWTAQYIALRGAREPDAFPAGDLGLLRGAAAGAARPTPAQLLERAERWRPFRAYAAQHLWAADATRMRE